MPCLKQACLSRIITIIGISSTVERRKGNILNANKILNSRNLYLICLNNNFPFFLADMIVIPHYVSDHPIKHKWDGPIQIVHWI